MIRPIARWPKGLTRGVGISAFRKSAGARFHTARTRGRHSGALDPCSAAAWNPFPGAHLGGNGREGRGTPSEELGRSEVGAEPITPPRERRVQDERPVAFPQTYLDRVRDAPWPAAARSSCSTVSMLSRSSLSKFLS